MTITREQFIEATGREPQDDDLERVNCHLAGAVGHSCCGWNESRNRPQFEVGPIRVHDRAQWEVRLPNALDWSKP